MARDSQIVLNVENYFHEVVNDALEKRSVTSIPMVKSYLVNLLKYYLNTDNLFRFSDEKGKRERSTLAELYLRAVQSEKKLKIELFRELGDSSLYISGFFGESLQSKIIDLDYYVEMGELAYDRLSFESVDDLSVKVYKEFSSQFKSYMDVLTYISQKTFTQNSKDLLKLYDRYIKTGSDLAKEQLIEQGVLNFPAKNHQKQ